jgi:hypothetical protein
MRGWDGGLEVGELVGRRRGNGKSHRAVGWLIECMIGDGIID